MANLIRAMELVHMAPPTSESVVSFLYKEHLANDVDKVFVVSKEGIKALISMPPKVTPGGRNILCNIQ